MGMFSRLTRCRYWPPVVKAGDFAFRVCGSRRFGSFQFAYVVFGGAPVLVEDGIVGQCVGSHRGWPILQVGNAELRRRAQLRCAGRGVSAWVAASPSSSPNSSGMLLPSDSSQAMATDRRGISAMTTSLVEQIEKCAVRMNQLARREQDLVGALGRGAEPCRPEAPTRRAQCCPRARDAA